jgi:hypothetical protein
MVSHQVVHMWLRQILILIGTPGFVMAHFAHELWMLSATLNPQIVSIAG